LTNGRLKSVFICLGLTVFVFVHLVRAQKPEENGTIVSEDLAIEEVLAEEFLDEEIDTSPAAEKGMSSADLVDTGNLDVIDGESEPDMDLEMGDDLDIDDDLSADELLMEIEFEDAPAKAGSIDTDIDALDDDASMVIDEGLEELFETDDDLSMDAGDALEVEDVIQPVDVAEDDVDALLATDVLEAGESTRQMKDETQTAPGSSSFATGSGFDSIRLAHEREEIRRRALADHATEQLLSARGAARKSDYVTARKLYEQAISTLEQVGVRPETRGDLERARRDLLETIYRRAEVVYGEGDLEGALILANEASRSGNRKASRLAQRIRRDQEEPPVVEPSKRWEEPSFTEKQQTIKAHLRRGRQHYMVGEYNEAQQNFEHVLKEDQFNTEAIRWREKVAIKKHDRAFEEVESSRRDMMFEVRKRWNRGEYVGVTSDTIGDIGPAVHVVDTPEEKTRKKMESIIFPVIEFEDADITDVVLYLKKKGKEYDPDGKGVTFVLKLGGGGGSGGDSLGSDDDFDFDDLDDGASYDDSSGDGTITFSGYDHSLLEILNIVTSLADLKYRIEGRVILIVPLSFPEGNLIRQAYPVLPTLRERMISISSEISDRDSGDEFIGLGGSGGFEGGTTDWKEFFRSLGVDFPGGSEIQYLPSIGKIIVKNTASNLSVFERVLSIINVVPKQIEIEARFVEVNQTDLMSLGFEYFITDEWEIAQKSSDKNKPLSARERVVVEQSEVSIGERFLTDELDEAGVVGGVEGTDNLLAISSFLTNPDLRIVIHALEQKGNADLLSAPKIMTKSGQEAEIKVVTEYIYPSDYTVEPGQPSILTESGISAGVPPLVTPSEFETREVGVILQVLPEVTADGEMINLTMSPEVVTEPEWFDYGQTFTDASGQIQTILIQQPFFNSRSIRTSILVYNGATVVMGGMITEERIQVEDKIPFLGDIPILGRFFRSNYDNSIKLNLLIFVTARLVDPSGQAVGGRRDGAGEVVSAQDSNIGN